MPMHTTSRLAGAALFGALLCVGCAHPTYSPYGYGGYGGYGPTYAPGYAPSYAQPQYLGPSNGPTYVPQSTPSAGSPTPLSKPPTTNSPLNLRPNPTSPSDTDAPSFNPNPPGSNRPVPNPRDPLDELNGSNPGASAALPRSAPTTAQLPTFERGGLAAAAPPVVADIVQTSGGAEPDPFEAPSRLPTDLDANPMGPPAEENALYQYDGQTYKWLKGTVDYDALSRTWSLIYNLKPEISDRYGGSFTLSAHPDLAAFQSGDVVLIEGLVDPKAKDATGRPIYTITKVTGPLR